MRSQGCQRRASVTGHQSWSSIHFLASGRTGTGAARTVRHLAGSRSTYRRLHARVSTNARADKERTSIVHAANEQHRQT
jgi:hypothetical protein